MISFQWHLIDTTTGRAILAGSLAECRRWLPVFAAAGVACDVRKVLLARVA